MTYVLLAFLGTILKSFVLPVRYYVLILMRIRITAVVVLITNTTIIIIIILFLMFRFYRHLALLRKFRLWLLCLHILQLAQLILLDGMSSDFIIAKLAELGLLSMVPSMMLVLKDESSHYSRKIVLANSPVLLIELLPIEVDYLMSLVPMGAMKFSLMGLLQTVLISSQVFTLTPKN